MFDERHSILLLLARCINVGNEEWDIVPTHQGSKAADIELLHGGLDVAPCTCLVRLLAGFECYVWHSRCTRHFWGSLLVNSCSHCVNLLL